MKAKQIVGMTIEFIVKVVVFVAIVMFIFNTSVKAYDYGYRVFAEEPVSAGEGRIISVIVEKDDSVTDIGKMLEEKGLIRDAKLFTIQEFLSEYHGKIQPGIYDLSTSMTSQEMMAVMSAENVDEEDAADDSTTTYGSTAQTGATEDGVTEEDTSDDSAAEDDMTEDGADQEEGN